MGTMCKLFYGHQTWNKEFLPKSAKRFYVSLALSANNLALIVMKFHLLEYCRSLLLLLMIILLLTKLFVNIEWIVFQSANARAFIVS